MMNGWLSGKRKHSRLIPRPPKWNGGSLLLVDPYGVYSDLPEECQQVGREYFARNPGSDIWVSFQDLPADTSDALWERHKKRIAFPAGLEGILEAIDDCDGGQCKI